MRDHFRSRPSIPILCKQSTPSALTTFTLHSKLYQLHAVSKKLKVTLAHARLLNARSMSQGNPAFPGRNIYASSSKLPDRTAQKSGTNAPSQQYTQSTFGRRPEAAYQFGQSTAPLQQQQHGRQSMEKEPNALSELSEEQRDEINESVGAMLLLMILCPVTNWRIVLPVRP